MDARALLLVGALLLAAPAASACGSCTYYAVRVDPLCEEPCPALGPDVPMEIPLRIEVAWEMDGRSIPLEGNPDGAQDVHVTVGVAAERDWAFATVNPSSYWFSPLRDGRPEVQPPVPGGADPWTRWSHTQEVVLTLVADQDTVRAVDNGTLPVFVKTGVHVPGSALGGRAAWHVEAIALDATALTVEAPGSQTTPAVGLAVLASVLLALGARRAHDPRA